jgi:alpha-tubulin suppressor-like RCC1 family protein
MHRRVLIALLGLIILGFFIATLANLDSVSRVFAADPSTLWGWGENGAGQLGDGTYTSKNTPTQEVTGATNWSAIAAGTAYTVALKSDNTLWASGGNYYGVLGDGTNISRNTLTQIGSATNWSAIVAGDHHAVALKSDGTLWTWGYNYYGQLATGTQSGNPTQTNYSAAADKNTPTQETTGATNWTAIAAGEYHTVALKSDGTLWAWGNNNNGRLGDGTGTLRTTPTQEVTGATNWSAIVAGDHHTVIRY